MASNGIVVSFLGGFEGTVSLHHLPSSETPPTSFTTNKKVKGRLLWVDVEAKKVGVSLQRTLVEGRSFTFQGVEFGDIYEGRCIYTKILRSCEERIKIELKIDYFNNRCGSDQDLSRFLSPTEIIIRDNWFLSTSSSE